MRSDLRGPFAGIDLCSIELLGEGGPGFPLASLAQGGDRLVGQGWVSVSNRTVVGDLRVVCMIGMNGELGGYPINSLITSPPNWLSCL